VVHEGFVVQGTFETYEAQEFVVHDGLAVSEE